jgi:hypothetical protein
MDCASRSLCNRAVARHPGVLLRDAAFGHRNTNRSPDYQHRDTTGAKTAVCAIAQSSERPRPVAELHFPEPRLSTKMCLTRPSWTCFVSNRPLFAAAFSCRQRLRSSGSSHLRHDGDAGICHRYQRSPEAPQLRHRVLSPCRTRISLTSYSSKDERCPCDSALSFRDVMPQRRSR